MLREGELAGYASDAAFAVDGTLRLVAWNDAAETLFGYSAEEVVGRFCHEVLRAVLPSGEPVCTPRCEGGRRFGRCEPFAVERCLVRHRNGQWLPVSLSSLIVPKDRAVPAAGPQISLVFLHPVRAQPKAQGSAAEPVRVLAFGRFAVVVGDRRVEIERWARKSALTLFKYLVVHLGSPVHRDQLIDCLWPEAEEQKGRARLKVAVHFLRSALRNAGAPGDVVETAGETYRLRGEALSVDTELFARLVAEGVDLERRGRGEAALRCYEDARRLYRGDYLEDEPYKDWCAEERERLREVYLEVLARAMHLLARSGRYEDAVTAGRDGLRRDSCRETFHRALMECFVHLGRSDWAIRQYQCCERVLARELGVRPLPETQHLYRSLLAERRG